MTRQATHTEIRDHLGHGTGNRVVKISRDGSVTYYGSTTDTDRSHDYWHSARHVEEYVVDSDGNVILGARPVMGRPLLGAEPRKRYLVTLEPSTAEAARRLGGGNLSGGIAIAVSRADTGSAPAPARRTSRR